MARSDKAGSEINVTLANSEGHRRAWKIVIRQRDPGKGEIRACVDVARAVAATTNTNRRQRATNNLPGRVTR